MEDKKTRRIYYLTTLVKFMNEQELASFNEKYEANKGSYFVDRSEYYKQEPTEQEIAITKAYFSETTATPKLIGERFGVSGATVRNVADRTSGRLLFQKKSLF